MNTPGQLSKTRAKKTQGRFGAGFSKSSKQSFFLRPELTSFPIKRVLLGYSF